MYHTTETKNKSNSTYINLVTLDDPDLGHIRSQKTWGGAYKYSRHDPFRFISFTSIWYG